MRKVVVESPLNAIELFSGAWSEAMRQLGNAVPVELAAAVSGSVRATLGGMMEHNPYNPLDYDNEPETIDGPSEEQQSVMVEVEEEYDLLDVDDDDRDIPDDGDFDE